jgi:hypothetical protein
MVLGVFHPIRRIGFAPWGNLLGLRQSESVPRRLSPHRPAFAILAEMAAPDPILDQILARLARLDVVKNRGGYTISDRKSGNKLARLRPFPKSDGFEILYWSLARESWRTFGPLGPIEFSLDEACEIIQNESIFQPPRRSWFSRIFS